MFARKNFYSILFLFLSLIIIQSCGKKEEQTFVPPGQDSSINLEKERLEREEFERLKRLRDGITDSTQLTDSLTLADSLRTDSLKLAQQKNQKTKFIQKEKELNKRLDNPKVTISDYIEFLQRGTSEGGNFEQNMKRASELWETSNVNRFKTNYKNTKKLTVLEEPKVVSQTGNTAVVQVKLKKTDSKNGNIEDVEMTVKYNLVADSKGKWKIKGNTVATK